jgi:hypothetical protein
MPVGLLTLNPLEFLNIKEGIYYLTVTHSSTP